jgi:dipeptidyl aminopeptidase B
MDYSDANPRPSTDSLSSVSTTSLVFERISERSDAALLEKHRRDGRADVDDDDPLKEDDDLENARFLAPGARVQAKGMDRRLFRILVVGVGVLVAAWFGALAMYVVTGAYRHGTTREQDPSASKVRGSGKTVTLDQWLGGMWTANSASVQWITSPEGEDGLLLLRDNPGRDYLVVEDVRASEGHAHPNLAKSRTLMKDRTFQYGGQDITPSALWPSPDLRKVLISAGKRATFRYSFTATYWILDVATQLVEPLDWLNSSSVLQMATWSPNSDMIAYTKDGNLYLRRLDVPENKKITQITHDGGPMLQNGVPDWVYEEEVIGSHIDTYWSADGTFLAFMKYNQTGVPSYPVQFFIEDPTDGAKSDDRVLYPYVKNLPYPKAGMRNPTATYHFYDLEKNEVFDVPVKGSLPDDTRVVTNVVWVGGSKAIIKEANRGADLQVVILIDAEKRAGVTVQMMNATESGAGWFDVTKPRYVPADPDNGRPHDGYIDFVTHGFGDHLGYFTPPDNPEPIMLTSGDWEVTGQEPMSTNDKPNAIDLKNNRVYFTATKKSSIERHVYSVGLDGSDMKPFTDTSEDGYYGVSFSANAGFALVKYKGPDIPYTKLVSTPSNTSPKPWEKMLEDNKALREVAKKHELPIKRYGTISIDDYELNYVEHLPPHFDSQKKHPVLFFQYSGPKSQTVTKQFAVSFQTTMASMGYVVVTVDGRGTGFMGLRTRAPIRGHLGRWEAHDQAEAGKLWAKKSYVDPSRLCIWGWSFGGYNTLKTLELDGGQTFRYGMAVAPVTDWRFYDSVYTERYMGMPQDNPSGYDGTAVHNVTSLGQNVRFLIMHGVADDNVHMQNTLKLLDDLNREGITNFDVHVFPDSNHGIYFHNARYAVYHSELRPSSPAWHD